MVPVINFLVIAVNSRAGTIKIIHYLFDYNKLVYLIDTYKWDAPIIALTVKINQEDIPKSKLTS
jgi:hypothetical protein